jgi:UDP-3-O-[3-hydroxymyristoyl] glucosamine N-acyltransferase
VEGDAMKFSELPDTFGLNIVRDGAFECMGILAYRDNPSMFVFIENVKYLRELDRAIVSCVVCPASVAEHIGPEFGVAIAESPRKAFFAIHNYLADTAFCRKLTERFIDPTAKVDSRATVPAESLHIGAGSVIEANVVIAPNTWIGDNVTIRAGTVIGSDGFQFIRNGEDIIAVRHAGGVWLCDGVEIQSSCCVDRSVFGGYTRIGENTKIGQFSLVAHNTVIGKRCLIAPHAMIAGSAVLGDDIWLGPSVTISSAVKIGDRASLTIGSVATKDVPPGQKVSGNFAIEHERFIGFIKTIR